MRFIAENARICQQHPADHRPGGGLPASSGRASTPSACFYLQNFPQYSPPPPPLRAVHRRNLLQRFSAGRSLLSFRFGRSNQRNCHNIPPPHFRIFQQIGRQSAARLPQLRPPYPHTILFDLWRGLADQWPSRKNTPRELVKSSSPADPRCPVRLGFGISNQA